MQVRYESSITANRRRSRCPAPGYPGAGARFGAPLADAAQSIGSSAAARRRNDPHHQRRQSARRSARRRLRIKGALPAVVAIVALVLAALPGEPISAQAGTQHATIPTPIPTPSFASVPTVAPGYRAPEAEPSSPGIIGVTQRPFVGITLQDAVGMALVKNPELGDLRFERSDCALPYRSGQRQLRRTTARRALVELVRDPAGKSLLCRPGSFGMATRAVRSSAHPIPALPAAPVTSS